MKTIADHAGYGAAALLLKRMQDEFDRLTTERNDILAKLRWKEPTPTGTAGTLDRARAILDGEPLPLNRSGEDDRLRERELEIRERLEVLRAALGWQPQEVERQRDRARAEAWSAATEQTGIAKAWATAEAALLAAIVAEDALLDRLAAGGFGCGGPVATNPTWLTRDACRDALRSAMAKAA